MKKGTASFGLALLSAAIMVFLFLSRPYAAEKRVKFPPEFLSLSHSQSQAAKVRVPRILDSLMVFHPGWITRSVTGHDRSGGNADGAAGAPPSEGGYRVLFHGKGEGRITRIWMSPGGVKGLKDYKELWILADGHTVYKGKPADLFEGKGEWKAPLVSAHTEGAGAFLSYVPFSYSREAKVLFKGDPRYFQITYRQGAGSSAGPGYREIEEFLSEPWAENAPAAKRRVTVVPGKPAVLAKGPLTVAALSLRCKHGDISRLRVRIGGQKGVPVPFLFGLGNGAPEPLKGTPSFRSAVNYVDAKSGFMATRLPIPLQDGEELVLEAEEGGAVEAAYGLAEADARPGVRLIARYRDQAGPGAETAVPFFESAAPVQFVSLVGEITGGSSGHLLEGGAMLRTDGIDHPSRPGAGAAYYHDDAMPSKEEHAGPFAGRPGPLSEASGEHGARHSFYRHHLLDPIISRADMRFGFEAGERKEAGYRALGLAYTFDAFRLVSRSSARPDSDGQETELKCPASFAARAGSKDAGGRGVLLVRSYEASAGAQEAALRLNGRHIGTIFEAYSDPLRSPAGDALWADLRSSDCAGGSVSLIAGPAAGSSWNKSSYEALFFDTDASEDAPMALKQGSNIRLCDAGIPGGPFYINDHTIVRGPDGRWHLMGIFHHELADPLNEIDFVHARAPAGDPADWSGEDFVIGKGTAGVALSVDRSLGETHLWAPHVARNGDEYIMAFHSGGPEEESQIKIARSRDLEHWERVPAEPLFTDICTARDPMLLKAGDLWVMYYTRCDGPETHINGVAYRTSADLVRWSEPSMAMTLPRAKPLPNSGYTESPFVFERGGWYYLSVTSYPVEYDASFLYRSRSPFNFGDVSVAKFKSHAPEWVEGGDDPGYGPLFITHAGWGQGGVWLAPVTGW